MIAWGLATLCLLVLTAFHLTAGEKEVARPLRRSHAFPADIVAVLLLCWHVVTLAMLLAALAFAAAAIDPDRADYAVAANIGMGMLALLCLAVVILRRQRHRDMPQWIAFALVAGLGVLGQMTA